MQPAKPYIVKGSKTKESRSLSASKSVPKTRRKPESGEKARKSVEREAEIEQRVNRLRDADFRRASPGLVSTFQLCRARLCSGLNDRSLCSLACPVLGTLVASSRFRRGKGLSCDSKLVPRRTA